MKRFVCCPAGSIPNSKEADTEYISLYESVILTSFEVGDVALQLKAQLSGFGIKPSMEAWDFCTIAMAVSAVDKAVPRSETADGWTRVLNLEIHINEPLLWQNQIPALESCLRTLTGDFWSISLTSGGEPPPRPRKPRALEGDCVSLLSGGVDSLVGAIDLCRSGRKPVLVSKLVSGDRVFQTEVAERLDSADRHIQLSHSSRSNLEGESSTRGRSLIFFAYAALVASALSTQSDGCKTIELFVPENGFISLNLPLTPLRIGTLSTKTTHPVYIRRLQEIWDAVGITATLTTPFEYRFETKGEMLKGCRDKKLLRELIGKSTSCGRYGVFSHKHCGRCVPCLVRRAAFLEADIPDTTEESVYKGEMGQYVYPDLSPASRDPSAHDIRAAGLACLQVDTEGIESLIAGGLAFSSPIERDDYKGVVDRGIAELRRLLKSHNVL